MSLLSSSLRGAGRTALWGARAGMPGARLAAGMAGRVAESTLTGTLQFGAAAGATAVGLGYAGYRGALALGGGRFFTSKDGLPRLMGGIQAAMVAGPAGVAAGLGYRSEMAQRKGGWGVSQAPGQPLEMERSDFMGATGSLALHARPPQTFAQATAASLNVNWGRYGAIYADDAAHVFLAALHR